MFTFDAYVAQRQQVIADAFRAYVPVKHSPATLVEAVNYSLFSGGKQLRPMLCLATAELFGVSYDKAMLPALAVQCIHTYSLIHDDLPALDNDDIRRGKPSNHKVFGEANAILAGDALVTLAFEFTGQSTPQAPYTAGDITVELAKAAGMQGMVGGQVDDMAAEKEQGSEEQMLSIHARKTGALLTASVTIGAMVGGATAEQVQQIRLVGKNLGMAFQFMNDINGMGKDGVATSDETLKKLTAVTVYGVQGAHDKANQYIAQAVTIINGLPGDTEPLQQLAQFVGK